MMAVVPLLAWGLLAEGGAGREPLSQFEQREETGKEEEVGVEGDEPVAVGCPWYHVPNQSISRTTGEAVETQREPNADALEEEAVLEPTPWRQWGSEEGSREGGDAENTVSSSALEDSPVLLAGEWILLSAGTSSVGICLIQLAKMRGYRTVVVVRREGVEEASRPRHLTPHSPRMPALS